MRGFFPFDKLRVQNDRKRVVATPGALHCAMGLATSVEMMILRGLGERSLEGQQQVLRLREG
jgi:hypothetical protein